MALPGSGQLSINDIVGEFGGSAPHALSEYYRGGSLVPDSATNSGVPTSGQIKISDFYGAANSVWTTNLTVGQLVGKFNTITGYDSATPIGSLSDTTVDFLGGAFCESISHGSASTILVFTVTGNKANSGFTTMTINGNNFNRTSASYSYNSSGDFTQWAWSASNPFSSVGQVDTVNFT
jgi:hypothetical protein